MGSGWGLALFLKAFSALHDPGAWQHMHGFPVPATNEAWFVVFVFAAAASALIGLSDPIRSLFFRRFRRQQWEICVTSKNDDNTDKDSWNIIEMRREDITGSEGLPLDKNKTLHTVVVSVRGGWWVRTHMARLKVNQQHAPGKVSMHSRLVGKLGLGQLAEADASNPDACSAQLDFGIRTPAWYLLVPFWKHPDPSIRLQWQMSFLFLFLGIVVPKFLEKFLVH